MARPLPPRVRTAALWRVPPEFLREAQDDATPATVRAQEAAGLDLDHPGSVRSRSGIDIPVPRVVGDIRRPTAVQVEDARRPTAR